LETIESAAMKTSATSTIMAVVLAAGLTAHGNPSVEPLCRNRIMRVGAVAAGWIGKSARGVREILESGSPEVVPGPACAVLVAGDITVGIDCEGYAACRGTGFAGDLAAITGSAVRCDSVGQRLTDPGVELGLAVVRAFNRSDDLPDLLSEVNVADLENPKVILCGGVVVEIGTGDYATKIRRLRQVLLRAPELGIRPYRVDMRFGPQVVVEYDAIKTQARKEA
jgi:hypothetical protein